MKGGKDDKSKCTVQAKAGRNGKVVFATLSPLGFLFPMFKPICRGINFTLFPPPGGVEKMKKHVWGKNEERETGKGAEKREKRRKKGENGERIKKG